jgi:hypothetical protein
VSSGPNDFQACTAFTKNSGLHAVCSTRLFGESAAIYIEGNSRHKPSNSDFEAPGIAPFVKCLVQSLVKWTSGKPEQFFF